MQRPQHVIRFLHFAWRGTRFSQNLSNCVAAPSEIGFVSGILVHRDSNYLFFRYTVRLAIKNILNFSSSIIIRFLRRLSSYSCDFVKFKFVKFIHPANINVYILKEIKIVWLCSNSLIKFQLNLNSFQILHLRSTRRSFYTEYFL